MKLPGLTFKNFEIETSILERAARRIKLALSLLQATEATKDVKGSDSWGKRVIEAADLGNSDDDDMAFSQKKVASRQNVQKIETIR